MLTNARVEEVRRTVACIVASPLVDGYKIGLTVHPTRKRFLEWRKWDYEHMVVLADSLSCRDALDLEERLWAACRSDADSLLYKKWEDGTRDGPYRRSGGGRDIHEDEARNAIYMIWWEPEREAKKSL